MQFQVSPTNHFWQWQMHPLDVYFGLVLFRESEVVFLCIL